MPQNSVQLKHDVDQICNETYTVQQGGPTPSGGHNLIIFVKRERQQTKSVGIGESSFQKWEHDFRQHFNKMGVRLGGQDLDYYRQN